MKNDARNRPSSGAWKLGGHSPSTWAGVWGALLLLGWQSILQLPSSLAQTPGSQEYTFTTLAGPPDSGLGAIDGPGSAARFYRPSGVAVDSAGNVYVADYYNNTIRKVTPDGVVTTLAGNTVLDQWGYGIGGYADGMGGAARFNRPNGVAVDSAGNVYVADTVNHTIRKVTPAGLVTTLAGSAGSAGSVDGTGSAARFNSPPGVAVDSAGNVYVADERTIRKVTPGAVVTTLAGTAGFAVGKWAYADGTGSAARFNNPSDVAVDSAGNVYVADRFNHTVRKVTAGGVVTTLAGRPVFDQWGFPLVGFSGGGFTDGTGSAAQFEYPDGVAVDSAGNVYVADYGNQRIRKVTPSGVVTTLAGAAVRHPSGMFAMGGYADGTGSAARFNNPAGVAVDSGGNVYVADAGNHAIRKVTPGGTVTTLAGPAGRLGSTDGTGSAARFAGASGVAVDNAGNMYVADAGNHTIRKVMPGGVVTTLAGLAGADGSADGTGSAARFNNPSGMAVDSAGNVYVADGADHTIRKVTPAGVVTTLAGLAGADGSADGTGSAARFYQPFGVAVDSAGNIYVADCCNHTIRKVTPDGVVTTLAGLAGRFGNADGTGSAARFYYPKGVAVDSAGTVYVVEIGRIRKVTPDGMVTTLRGVGCSSFGVAVDSAGDVYVADSDNHTIRKVTPGGVVATLAGRAETEGGADGTGSGARFNEPGGVAVDSAGNVYVADGGTIRIGAVACPDLPTIDLAVAPVGQLRQLDTQPQTAVAWQWQLIRQPAASTAALSDANVRNPTFTPDVADLYVFRLKATNALGAICIRSLELRAVPAKVAAILASPQVKSDGSFELTLLGQSNQSYTLQVSTDLTTWTDWTNVTSASFDTTLTDPAADQERQRFYRALTR